MRSINFDVDILAFDHKEHNFYYRHPIGKRPIPWTFPEYHSFNDATRQGWALCPSLFVGQDFVSCRAGVHSLMRAVRATAKLVSAGLVK